MKLEKEDGTLRERDRYPSRITTVRKETLRACRVSGFFCIALSTS